MATETFKTLSLQLALENGRDAKGNMTYVKQSIQYARASGYTPEKYMSLVAALEPCLSKDVGQSSAIKTYAVTAS